MQFTLNKVHLDSETIAEQLRLARQDRGVKLEKISKELKINIKYLDALEKGRFELLPKGVYGKNFLREYAQYLRLDYRDMLEIFDTETLASQKIRERDLFNKQKVNAHDLLSYPKIVRGLLIGLVVFLVIIYLVLRLQKIVSPPILTIDFPANNYITREVSLDLRGRVENETQLAINGESVISSHDGSFNKTIGLKIGLNTVSLIAQKKYGRSKNITLQILRQ
ncbi:MAG: helix-turn-helix domain-containing protein [bacterium]